MLVPDKVDNIFDYAIYKSCVDAIRTGKLLCRDCGSNHIGTDFDNLPPPHDKKKRGITRVAIDSKSHPCLGHWWSKSKECKMCMVSTECRLIQMGEW